MNISFILIFSLIFTFIGEHILNEPIFPIKETGSLNLVIFSVVSLVISLAGILFFVRREYKSTKKNKMKFVSFFRQALLKNNAFLKEHADEKRPPFLVLTLFLAGISGIVGSLNGAHFLYYGGVNSWISVWIVVLIFGLFHGYIRYVMVGFLYQIGVWFSGGGFKGLLSSRNIAHYAVTPFFLVSVLTKTVEMFVYGEAYFVSPTYRWLNVLMLVLVMAAGLYSVILLYWAARHLKNTKKWRSILFFVAVPLLLLFVARGPSFGEAFDSMTQSLDYNNQGIVYMNNGDLDAAEQSFSKAIETLDPKNKDELVTAHINLATIYQQKGDVESARKSYEEALPYLSKTDAQYFGIQGVLKLYDDDVKGSIDLFDEAVKTDPQNFIANNYLGLIYMGQMGKDFVNPEKALSYNLFLHTKSPEDSVGLQNLALNYYQLGRFEEAMPLFEQLMPMMPNNPLVKLFLGLTYYKLGYESDAISLLDQAVKTEPKLLTEEVKKILEAVK